MVDTFYIRQKVWVAADCLFNGSGKTFERRLESAWVSSLHILSANDSKAEYAEELNTVLLLCKRHIRGGRCADVPVADRDLIERHLRHALLELDQMVEKE